MPLSFPKTGQIDVRRLPRAANGALAGFFGPSTISEGADEGIGCGPGARPTKLSTIWLQPASGQPEGSVTTSPSFFAGCKEAEVV